MFFNDLYALFVYFVCAIVISYVAFAISYIFGIRADDSNKLAAYECGFTPFDDARNTFEIHFYLVAILFITSNPMLCLVLLYSGSGFPNPTIKYIL